MCLLNKYYRNCGGHHDSDHIAVIGLQGWKYCIVTIILFYVYLPK